MAEEGQREAQPLADIRVVDMSHAISGPYCTRMLADYGADVIKVERPGGGDWPVGWAPSRATSRTRSRAASSST